MASNRRGSPPTNGARNRAPKWSTVEGDRIAIRGARQNNLHAVDVELPRDALVVVTGISGSGKSSLAFDTLFREGQRRFLETLSAYARQFLGGVQKPNVDSIEGLSPAIAVDQKSIGRGSRSTVGPWSTERSWSRFEMTGIIGPRSVCLTSAMFMVPPRQKKYLRPFEWLNCKRSF